MIGRAHLRAEVDGRGGVRLAVLRSTPPLSLRPTPDGVYLVGSAAGPLGGDDVALCVEVGEGAALTVRTVAASVALPGRGGRPSRVAVTARVAAGASLRWLPEPVVAAAGCDHRMEAAVSMADGAELEWREELVLGRAGERPGACRSSVRVDVGGRPLLRHELHVGADGWSGPAVLGGARAVGSVVLGGPSHVGATARMLGPRAAVLAVDGPGTLVSALADDAPALRALLDAGTTAAEDARIDSFGTASTRS